VVALRIPTSKAASSNFNSIGSLLKNLLEAVCNPKARSPKETVLE